MNDLLVAIYDSRVHWYALGAVLIATGWMMRDARTIWWLGAGLIVIGNAAMRTFDVIDEMKPWVSALSIVIVLTAPLMLRAVIARKKMIDRAQAQIRFLKKLDVHQQLFDNNDYPLAITDDNDMFFDFNYAFKHLFESKKPNLSMPATDVFNTHHRSLSKRVNIDVYDDQGRLKTYKIYYFKKPGT